MQEEARPDSSNDRLQSEEDTRSHEASADDSPFFNTAEERLPSLEPFQEQETIRNPETEISPLPPHYRQWESHMKLTRYHAHRGNRLEALHHALLAYELGDSMFSSYDRRLAQTHERLSAAYFANGKLLHAETCLQQAIRIHEQSGTAASDLAKKYDRLARIQEQIPDYDAVVHSLGTALRHRRTLPARNHIDDTINAMQLGRFLLKADKPEQAIPLLQQSCFEFRNVSYAKRHQAIPLLQLIAEECHSEGHLELAETLLYEALYHAHEAPLQNTDIQSRLLVSLGMNYLHQDAFDAGKAVLHEAMNDIEQQCLIYSSARWSRTKTLVQALMLLGDTEGVQQTLHRFLVDAENRTGPLFRDHMHQRMQEAKLLLSRSYLAAGHYSLAAEQLSQYQSDKKQSDFPSEDERLQELSLQSSLFKLAHQTEKAHECDLLRKEFLEASLQKRPPSNDEPYHGDTRRSLLLAQLCLHLGDREKADELLLHTRSVLPAHDDAPKAWLLYHKLAAQAARIDGNLSDCLQEQESVQSLLQQGDLTVGVFERTQYDLDYAEVLEQCAHYEHARELLALTCERLERCSQGTPLHLRAYKLYAAILEHLSDHETAQQYYQKAESLYAYLQSQNQPPYFEDFTH